MQLYVTYSAQHADLTKADIQEIATEQMNVL